MIGRDTYLDGLLATRIASRRQSVGDVGREVRNSLLGF